jgi:hypothetical protein
MIYSAGGLPFTVDLGKLSGETCRGYWFDPRTGASREIGLFPRRGSLDFVPPANAAEPDWVLVLDDDERGFDLPGTKTAV